MPFLNEFTSAPGLPALIREGKRGAHVLGISFLIAKSRNMIGTYDTFEQYQARRLKAEAEEIKLNGRLPDDDGGLIRV